MGTTYFVANTAKRQYFDPGDAGGSEETRRSSNLWGLGGHTLGVLLLPEAKLEFHLNSWIGDPLVLVGDQAEPNSIELLQPFRRDDSETAYHIVTEVFDDITLNLIAQLCKRGDLMAYFLNEADQHDRVFIRLVHIATYLRAAHVEIALAERFGPDWRKRYLHALRSMVIDYPLPMTPENKGRNQVLRAADVIKQIKHGA